MKSVIDKITRIKLYDTLNENVYLNANEELVDFIPEINVVTNEDLISQALVIDFYYTELISKLLRKHIEKLTIDSVPVPQDAIDERNALRTECNNKILDLGITNFSYRQQYNELAL